MKRQLFRLFIATAAVSSALASAPAAWAQQRPDKFKIGAILAMTGPSSQYGEEMSQGILLAVEEINANGGIDGIPLEAIIEDHQSGSAKEGVAAMNRLISIHGAKAVLSSFSGPTLAIAPIADREKIFVINGGGVSTKLVNASKYMVHNRVLATTLADSVMKLGIDRGYKRAAIVSWKNESGDSVLDLVQKGWPKDGRQIVSAEPVVPGTPNIDTQIVKIKAARPDVVFLATWQPTTGLAVKRIRELKIDAPIIGVDWSPVDANVAGQQASKYEYVLESFNPSDKNPWSQQFDKAFRKKYNGAPGLYAANYYEGTYVIAELIRRAKAKGGDYWSGDKLHASLRDNPVLKSVFGPTMKFDESTGLAAKPLNLFRVDANGKTQFIDFVGN